MPPSREAIEAAKWDVSNECYHADSTSFSNSTLTTARASPKSYEWTYLLNRITRKGTRAMDFGTAFHESILEPEQFEKRYAIRPTHYEGPDGPEKISWKKPKNLHKQYVEKWSADNIGKDHLTPQEIESLKYMTEAVKEHDTANEIIYREQGECEFSIRVTEPTTGMLVKSRYDKVVFRTDTIINLKTACKREFHDFRRTIEDRDYDNGAALACFNYQVAFGIFPTHVFLVVENEPPYECECYDLGKESLYAAHERNLHVLNRIKAMQAVSTPEQSGYRSETHGTLIHIESSKWRRKES